MELWTWQHPELDIHNGVYDPTRSEFVDGFPDYLPALQEVAQYLGIDIDKFIWASREYRVWRGRVGYCLDVPEEKFLAVIDDYLWNLRFGNKDVRAPSKLRTAWKEEAELLYPQDGKARRKYEDRKQWEWQRRPLPPNWWSQAIEDGRTSENPQYLLPYPIPKDWVVPPVVSAGQ